MKTMIIGAGIGGLTAAIAMARAGHEVEVLEQAPEPAPVGAGISLQPNAMFALGALGLDEAVKQRAYAASIARLSRCDGALIREFDFGPQQERYGYLPYTIHRADLFDVLFQSALDAGVKVSFGHRFDSLQQRDSGVTVDVGGESRDVDAVVGADGIHSRVREQLWGTQSVRYAGYVCWRGIVAEPELVDRVTVMNEIWGKGARFGFMRCSSSKIYWFATRTTKERQRPDASWRNAYRQWPSLVGALLDATPEDQTVFTEICDRAPISPWAHGPVTLLGDAAHPMTPNFGQGGAQAIEDAVVLSRVMQKDPDPVGGFREYEQRRSKRTADLVRRSRSYGNIAQGGSWLARSIRDRLLLLLPESMMEKAIAEQLDVQSHLAVDGVE